MWGVKEKATATKVLFRRGGTGQQANRSVYFDQLRRYPRLSQDDSLAHDALLAKHFPGVPLASAEPTRRNGIRSLA